MNRRIDRQAAFSGTREVSERLSIDATRLSTFLERALAGFRAPVRISQFKGGQSNPTYLIKAASGNYVLRRKPPGPLLPSAHAIEREYRVMHALGMQGFPVPNVHLLCEDEEIIGTPFYVMEEVAGRVIWEPHVPGVGTRERGAIFAALNETIARLHQFDPAALGLEDFGRPENYVARQIARWSRQYAASATDPIPQIDALIAWLPQHVPQQQRATLVHGDFRLDNVILAPDEPRIVAVLDWELATLGDPLADFTYHLMQWVMPPSPLGAGVGSLLGHDLATLGIPSLEDYAASYCEKTGINVLPHLNFYLAYNFFRLAAIFQGIVARARSGNAANENAEAMASQVGPLAKVGWDYARRAGAI